MFFRSEILTTDWFLALRYTDAGNYSWTDKNLEGWWNGFLEIITVTTDNTNWPQLNISSPSDAG